MSLPPKVIVLVLSYNGKHLLDECLTSYSENNYTNFEIVVIDNGSNDGTEIFVNNHFPKVKIIRLDENCGYSGGFNYGIKFALRDLNADFILISNNDVKADSKVIEELVKVAKSKPKIGFSTGKVYFYESNGFKDILQTVGKDCNELSLVGNHIGFGEKDIGQHDEIKARCLTDDVFMLVSRELIETVGSYYEGFFHESEQADWQFRGVSEDFKIMYTPHAKIWHKVSSTVGSWNNPLITFYRYRSGVLLIRRNTSDNHFIIYFFNRLFNNIPKSLISFILKGRIDLIFPMLSGFLSGIKWVIQNPDRGFN